MKNIIQNSVEKMFANYLWKKEIKIDEKPTLDFFYREYIIDFLGAVKNKINLFEIKLSYFFNKFKFTSRA